MVNSQKLLPVPLHLRLNHSFAVFCLQRRPGGIETAGPGQGVRISVIERKVRSETEDKLRKEFEEKETRSVALNVIFKHL